MGRKKTKFQLIREDQEGEPEDFSERPDRQAARRETKALGELAVRLVALVPSKRARLPLSDELRQEIERLGGLRADGGRRRQLKRVIGLLREADAEAIEAAMVGRDPEDTRLHMIERWRTRLIAEGDPAIQAFVDGHDDVDRGQLRALVRQSGGEGDKAARARKRLFQVLKAATPLLVCLVVL